jgi:hypothetical protein
MAEHTPSGACFVRGVQVSVSLPSEVLGLLMRFWGSIAFVSVFRGVPFNGQKTIRRQPAVLGS